MQENLSPQQGLQLIQSMIDKAKNQFSENGHLYLLWGWVVFFCSVVHFVLIKFVQYEKHYLIWILTCLAGIYQMIYLAKRKKQESVKTYTEHIMDYVWMAFVITMFLLGFVLVSEQPNRFYTLINPVFLALYGIPTFLSGIILQFKPLKIGGIICWVLSIASTFLPYEYQLLVLGTATVLAWIIPGYILSSKYKNQNI